MADLLQKQVENRQSYLQSQMLSAQDLSSLTDKINTTAQALIDSGDISIDTLDRSNEDALSLLSSIGESMINSMRRRPVTGIFVVLNTHDLDTRTDGYPLPCLYLRDLDPASPASARNSDLLIERAPSQVVQSLHISTDTCWTPSLLYSETRADGLLYPVFQAAYHIEADDLGHWTVIPYTLSGDTHSAIAYTMPLILDDGTVYGVLGVEMLESHLRSLLPSGELQNDGSGSYFFTLADSVPGDSESTASIITDSPGENAALEDAGEVLSLLPSDRGGYRVLIGGEYCHAAVLPLSLYSHNAPFYNEVPLLIGAVPESQLYAFSDHVAHLLIIAVLLEGHPRQLRFLRARRLRQRLQQRAEPAQALTPLHQNRPLHHPSHRHRRQQAPNRAEHGLLRAPAWDEGRGRGAGNARGDRNGPLAQRRSAAGLLPCTARRRSGAGQRGVARRDPLVSRLLRRVAALHFLKSRKKRIKIGSR